MSNPVTTRTVGFDFHPRTRLVFGNNSVDRLGELARELGATRVLIVTIAGVAAAGHLDRARHALESAELTAVVHDRAKENPTTIEVDDCVAFALERKVDCIVGLGGGSSLDTAKGCNLLLTNRGKMQDYQGYGKASRPLLPLIAVPTTAGTGSEMQSYTLIADEASHQKMACGDPKIAPAIAVLDPTLTVTQPRHVTACTGMDALGHAIETAVTRDRNEMSRLYSREAFKLLIHAFPKVLREPDDLSARAEMLLGAAHAGTSIELSMLGATHSAANPLTARFGVTHGHAIGMMLPRVIEFNAQDPAAADGYRDLMTYAGLFEGRGDAAAALVDKLEALLAEADMPLSPAAFGVTEEAIPALAAEAAKQWTAQFNPRTILAGDFEFLYHEAMFRDEATAA